MISWSAACGCKSSPTTTPATNNAASAATCATIHDHLVELYRADALAKEPARVQAATVDNVTMAEHECAHAAASFPGCAAAATSAAQFESTCMPTLDSEGSEGDKFAPARAR